MAFFVDTVGPARRGGRRARRAGWIILVVAILGIVIVGLTPAPYLIERPGPTFNTLGTTTIGKGQQPVISISGRKTYETSGALRMLTVNVDGDPQQPPSWAEIAQAWFDPSQRVMPTEELYPSNVSVSESNKEEAAEMTDSQQQATAAALTELGIRYTSVQTVADTEKGLPAAGVLKKGDILESANGRPFVDSSQLHTIVVANGTAKPMTVVFLRGGVSHTATITPVAGPASDPGAIIGVYVTGKYTFPFTVDIQLQNVGGPSAGQMFALGIIDKLTPGKLNGGADVAGTGTIVASGAIGAIGGIRQKLYGARNAGARYFLAPASNCDEVVGHVPSGIRVFSTSTLAQSVTELKAIAAGGNLASLPTCTAKS